DGNCGAGLREFMRKRPLPEEIDLVPFSVSVLQAKCMRYFLNEPSWLRLFSRGACIGRIGIVDRQHLAGRHIKQHVHFAIRPLYRYGVCHYRLSESEVNYVFNRRLVPPERGMVMVLHVSRIVRQRDLDTHCRSITVAVRESYAQETVR